MAEETKPSQNPKTPQMAPVPATAKGGDRDFLLHLEAYLARRDGVDKLLKISRYAAKIVLSTSLPSKALAPRLKAFESSVGLSRKAFRLGKFVQDVNAFRSADGSPSSADLLLAAVAYGGEGLYYFVEQFVWLSKAGLIPSQHLRRLQKISAWAELVGYLGSISLKAKELRKIRFLLESKVRSTKSSEDDDEIQKLRVKLLLKQLSLVQDFADGLMALGDVSDGKGFLSNPLLMASAGLLSALISTHKNWTSC
ncbi:peroxisomal membrane protein 11-3-like [Phoenix dactylifera]|uniref:Peroxisomal membrane protein 11-3-like n=1 Tax=Phoenix dactylifera TaxID=42345 RepID=A0A8B9A447_PHODC|nr:peroxisomal membrane protein 11-3-like [Phoenix dactylifera]XP_008807761.1 peroxisomal membrane protein 11-3-like [Phoenix dactylifera]XP_017701406.1 peroxisomal membrane protein 11-3-like [Phoenix dactylifera]XP_038980437.1 peroxisomal membrane protein 11-3-like [Phoenix dactylifera]XP_038980438.1 peroxisomal membrane protein 11-3-like [Phoenix dactylifera]XP_038980439.1 peroxisomal membrane protein 11-3-like [Phoenix dactylifera]